MTAVCGWDTRNSSKTQDAINAALVPLIDDDRVVADGSFLLLPDKPVTPRDRSGAENSSLRKPDNLPPAEVAAAVPPLIEAHHGLQVDELPKVVSTTLGFHALTQEIINNVDRNFKLGIEPVVELDSCCFICAEADDDENRQPL